MLWRSARKTLTRAQELTALQIYARLLERWKGNLNSNRRARLRANARCLALHPERFTSEHGARLRRQRAAKAAHASMRAQGRIPGEEGRAVIIQNRAMRNRDVEEGKGWRYGQTYVHTF
jgi:hypothetical protein